MDHTADGTMHGHADPSALECNISGLFEAVAAQVPDRPAIVQGELTLSYAALLERTRRLARFLADRGLGCYRERVHLERHQAGQHLMAQILHNSPAYLEGLLGGYRARVAPFNVNYRYVADELRQLLRDAPPGVIQYHERFAPTLLEVLPEIRPTPVLLQVRDGSGHGLIPDAIDYDTALASVPPLIDTTPSPDDLYVLFTGGTTGVPKGVLWRQADALVALMGLRDRAGAEWGSLAERLSAVSARAHRVMPLAPYMHGAAQWGALQTLIDGNTVVIPDDPRSFDPVHALDVVAEREVSVLTIVGDAFGRPLADQLEATPRSLPSLRVLVSGGSALSEVHKRRLVEALPGLTIIENVGSSESGPQGKVFGADGGRTRASFRLDDSAVVVSEDRTSVLADGHDGVGWLATRGRIPLGYLGDAKRTEATFPVIAGQRMSVPGDRARLLEGNVVELLGRDANTINSGGEKIFTEEVEVVLRAHPLVADAVVCGRPSDQWGSVVVGLVEAHHGSTIDPEDLREFCGSRLARYKCPKSIIFVDQVQRTPAGKPDYRWAAKVAG